MPVRFAGIGPLPSHPVVCAQFPERRKLSPNLLPLFPVDLTDASAQPFIGASDEFRHRRRREIVDPATDESLQLLSVLFKASADFSRQALLHRPVGAVSVRSPRVEHALSPHMRILICVNGVLKHVNTPDSYLRERCANIVDSVRSLASLKSSKAPTNYFTPNILRKSWSRLVVSVVHLDALAFPVAAT